jgi:nucleoside phosphorylase
MRWRSELIALILVAAAAGPAAAERVARDPIPPADSFCAGLSGTCVPPPYVVLMSAFPAELQPLLAAAEITETIVAGNRTYHVGTLAGVRVVLVRVGIGLFNAATTTRAVLDRFQVSAIVFSGVAGSRFDIGDVTVPEEWTDGTTSVPVDASLFAIAQTLTSPPVALERCTAAPPDPPGPTVCLGYAPRIVTGGRGESAGFETLAVPCTPGGGAIFGCDEFLVVRARGAAALPTNAEDEETAAVARLARDAGVPFIAFRGVSDGAGDPLGLVGSFRQFAFYYVLSADNAAATATAFLQAWSLRDPGITGATGRRRGSPRIGAACDWERAAGPACAGQEPPRAITSRVARACGLVTQAAAAKPGSARARAAETRARKGWQRAVQLLKTNASPGFASDCRQALVGAVEARARTNSSGESRSVRSR